MTASAQALTTCSVVEVIHTTLTTRGRGLTEADPVRVVEQYWTRSGQLLWEIDPCALNPRLLNDYQFTVESICHLLHGVSPARVEETARKILALLGVEDPSS